LLPTLPVLVLLVPVILNWRCSVSVKYTLASMFQR
jgi:hypothetical protein